MGSICARETTAQSSERFGERNGRCRSGCSSGYQGVWCEFQIVYDKNNKSRAFIGFVINFPQEAHKMLTLMDSGRRGLLEKELSSHPAGEILAQMNNSAKQRTTNPPNTLKLGTSSYASKNYKKVSVSDSGDESNTGKSKTNYSSLSKWHGKFHRKILSLVKIC